MAILSFYDDPEGGPYTAALYAGLITSNSISDTVLSDVNSSPVNFIASATGNTNYATDEDYSTTFGSYYAAMTATPLKALNDSELPAGEGGGGPTTTQIWQTG